MSPHTSPFKFLDSYLKEDSDIFFGREKETEDLYEALSGVKHLLVYGPAGAGKTSLIECGLRNLFSDMDWYALTIRRGTDMIESVFSEINDALREKIVLDPTTKRPLDPDTDFGQAIENLFAERYQPVYLLFDQFEELLISGSEDEKKDFFSRLNQLIRYKVPCRVLLIMREEFIGHLSEFEPLCPSIFQYRFRVEKMRKENVKSVIRETLDAPHFQNDFRVDDSASLAESILSRLPDQSREIELAHVQVFLSELWDRARAAVGTTGLPLLHEGLINSKDDLTAILDKFLKKELEALDKIYGKNAPLETLAAMISNRHTKLQLSEGDILQDLLDREVQLQCPLADLLFDLKERRILRHLKSGEQTQYEISHDVLALVVGQNLTREMEMRAKAADIYRVYEDRKGFFSQEDLDLIRPYQQYKAYPPALAQRIKESENNLNEQQAAERERVQRELHLIEEKLAAEERARRRQRFFIWLVSAVAVVALGASVFAFFKQKQATEASNLAEMRRLESEGNLKLAKKNEQTANAAKAEAEKNLGLAKTNLALAQENAVKAQNALAQADRNLKLAKQEEANAKAAFEQVQKEKDATEEQRIKAQKNYEIAQQKTTEAEASAKVALEKTKEAEQERDKAQAAREEAERNLQKFKAASADIVDALMREADNLIYHLDYAGAAAKLRTAADLDQPTASFKKALAEVAFFWNEAGQTAQAADLLAAAKQSDAPSEKAELQAWLKTYAGAWHDSLLRRYYPYMLPIPGGEARINGKNAPVSAFDMARTETTMWQYALYYTSQRKDMRSDEGLTTSLGFSGDNPVVSVTWYDAARYANWLSKQFNADTVYVFEGDDVKEINYSARGYRLPTEVEWEYAARGGPAREAFEYAGSYDLDSVGWYSGNSGSRTHPVAGKKDNSLGLYDMSGNVWEWCNDWYSDFPATFPADYRGPDAGSDRVRRGGSWDDDADDARVTLRYNWLPYNWSYNLGFRLARAVNF